MEYKDDKRVGKEEEGDEGWGMALLPCTTLCSSPSISLLSVPVTAVCSPLLTRADQSQYA